MSMRHTRKKTLRRRRRSGPTRHRRPSRTGGGVDAVKIAKLQRDLKVALEKLDKCRAELAAAVAELAHVRQGTSKLLDRSN